MIAGSPPPVRVPTGPDDQSLVRRGVGRHGDDGAARHPPGVTDVGGQDLPHRTEARRGQVVLEVGESLALEVELLSPPELCAALLDRARPILARHDG